MREQEKGGSYGGRDGPETLRWGGGVGRGWGALGRGREQEAEDHVAGAVPLGQIRYWAKSEEITRGITFSPRGCGLGLVTSP